MRSNWILHSRTRQEGAKAVHLWGSYSVQQHSSLVTIMCGWLYSRLAKPSLWSQAKKIIVPMLYSLPHLMLDVKLLEDRYFWDKHRRRREIKDCVPIHLTGIEAATYPLIPICFLVLAGIKHDAVVGRKNKRNLVSNDTYTYGDEEQKRNLRVLHRSSEPTRVKRLPHDWLKI